MLTTALGHDVVMPCSLSDNQTMIIDTPVLYWSNAHGDKLLSSDSVKYEGRVDRVDKNLNSSNKSILFKNVQWADSQKYLCKLSVKTKKDKNGFRIKGNQTLLLVYGKYKVFW